jgi:hypothetical protein
MKIKIELTNLGMYFKNSSIYYSEMKRGNVRNLQPQYYKQYVCICRRMKLKYNGAEVKR